MSVKIQGEFARLRFCPVCGKELEINPISNDPACFLHGDFGVWTVCMEQGRVEQILWRPTGLTRAE